MSLPPEGLKACATIHGYIFYFETKSYQATWVDLELSLYLKQALNLRFSWLSFLSSWGCRLVPACLNELFLSS